MNMRRRDFPLLVTLVAAAVTPALGQAVPPVVGPTSTSTSNAASIPDFFGIWSHNSAPGFEPPAYGAGPVVNKSRMREGPQRGVSNFQMLVGDYTNPILKPQAAEIVKKLGQISLSGVTYPTPSNQCWPGGVPYIFWNFGIQMVQQPEKITILYFYDHEFRQVRLNQPHPTRSV
jgi:hypothetical protein